MDYIITLYGKKHAGHTPRTVPSNILKPLL